VMGLPPFKGSISKFLIVYSNIENGNYVYAAAAILGSILEAWYFIGILHKICFAEVKEDAQNARTSGKVSVGFKRISYGFVLVLAVLTALTSLFPETLIASSESLVNSFLGTAKLAELPVFDSPWSTLVLVPYIGAFVVFAIGHFLPKLRGILAVCISAATVGLVWLDGSLDGLSKLFSLIISFIVLLASLYSIGYFKGEKHNNRYFFFLLLTLGSLIGVATSTQFGNFYVFWELMTWASYLLIVQEPTQKALKAGFKYFMMCTSGAYVMQFGILMLQGNLGTMDMAEVSGKLHTLSPGVLLAVIVMFIIGTGVKTGIVPMHSWLPEAHPAAPSPVSAMLSGILTKIGVYGMVRVLFAVFGIGALAQLGSVGKFSTVGLAISILGLVTLFYGEIMALVQTDIKRLLAYSTMAQVGEIITTIGLGTYLSMVAGFYHVLNHAVMKGLLFLAVGMLVHRLKTREITAFKGIGKVMPFTAGCLSIGILGMMGLPPFNGFISKFLMLYAAVNAGAWYFAALILLGSVIGAIYYIRLIKTIFFEKYEGLPVKDGPLTMLIPMGILTGVVLFNGLFPQFALKLVVSAADLVAKKGGMAAVAIPQIQVMWPLMIAIPMLGGLLAYFLGKRSAKAAGWISVAVMTATLAAIAVSSKNFDLYSLSFAILIAFVGILNLLYSLGYMGHGHAQNRYYMFFLMMIGGLIGVATSRDFFSFFIYWEIMSSWTLYFSIIHEETNDALKEGFKYFIFNYIGASLAFLGILLITAKAGTFDMGTLASRLGSIDLGTAGAGLILMTAGFLMKAAVMPFRIDYQMHPSTAPTPVSGYISSVLLKSAPYSLVKVLFLLGGVTVLAKLGVSGGKPVIMEVVSWIAGLTIFGAAAMAMVQRGIKRLLIYSTVSQIGYIILGISLGSTLGLAGGLLHFVNHMFFKDLLFLAAGAIMVQAHAHNLDEVSGLGRKMPWTMTFFMIGAFSLAGIPLFSGFNSKWIIYEAAMQQGQVFLALLSLAGSILSMAYFVKFMHSAFFGTPSTSSEHVKEAPWTMLVPMGALSALCIVLGIMPGLPLIVITKVLAAAGISQPVFTLFSVQTPLGIWQGGAVTMAVLLTIALGIVFLTSGNKKIKYTDAYTCGVSDIDADKINVAAQNLYETPAKVVGKLHKAIIVPIFGNGEEVQK
jgi:proton-translocating NADH-quinone oxidoreductase chain N